MKRKLLKIAVYFLILGIGIAFGIIIRHNNTTWALIKKSFAKTYVKFDDTRKAEWSKNFIIVDIKSSADNKNQKAYFYKSNSNSPKPLVISLHTWSGYFNQNDGIAKLCEQKNVNYIHPDFRGANWTKDACCSELALQDIDDAITYAINNSNVDTAKIYVVGVSGGGYATLCTFMKSNHNIKKFSAWASISDLNAWYNESRIRNNGYANDILNCTDSGSKLNEISAMDKSPIYWDSPSHKLSYSKLYIYAGIYDGIQGSVPITHSINFYNKLLKDMSVTDSSKYITTEEKLKLLEFRKPLRDFGSISGRKICLVKEMNNIKIIIFEGTHEMLTDFALNELLEE
jgi:pimeloyl-ACP methyl ester carboxylesterase